MGSVLSSSENYDYSVLSLASTRVNFDRTWDIFTDVVLHPAFTTEDFELEKERALSHYVTIPTIRIPTCKGCRNA